MKNNNKKICKDWFIELQNLICKAVLELEKEYGSTAKFKKNKWSKGEYRIIAVSYTHLTLPTNREV